jgi:ELMO/CED-12 family
VKRRKKRSARLDLFYLGMGYLESYRAACWVQRQTLEYDIINIPVDIGFQCDDPFTDFRGSGKLGLLVLYYFVKNHTQMAKKCYKVCIVWQSRIRLLSLQSISSPAVPSTSFSIFWSVSRNSEFSTFFHTVRARRKYWQYSVICARQWFTTLTAISSVILDRMTSCRSATSW